MGMIRDSLLLGDDENGVSSYLLCNVNLWIENQK